MNWKKIPNYSKYEASDTGFIKTFNWKNKGIEKVMSPALDEKGYYRTMLKNDDGKFDTIKVHRIIAITFLDNTNDKKEVNHKNGIKTDNSVENLEWCNRSENMKHAFTTNLCISKGKKVIDLSNGFLYKSASEAARVLNIPKSTLNCMLTGYRKNNTSLVYDR